MYNSKIGIATSFFADQNFDSSLTLALAHEENISWVQLFLSDYYTENPHEIFTLQGLATQHGTKIICHSPLLLNLDAKDGIHAANLSLFFPQGQEKFSVFHFDENETIENALSVIEFYSTNGFTICLENFYQDKSKDAFIQSFHDYLALIEAAQEKKYKIIPVLDFPRLFIEPITEAVDALAYTELLLDKLAKTTKNLILHLIDFSKSSQKREEWLPFMAGIMPYEKIFDLLKKYNFTIISAILEYENKEIGRQSFQALSESLDKLVSNKS